MGRPALLAQTLTRRLRSTSALLVLVAVVSGCGEPAGTTERWLDGLTAAPGRAEELVPWMVPTPADSAPTAVLAWHALWVAQGGSRAQLELVAAGSRLATRMDPVWGGVLEQPAEALGEGPAKSLHTQALALEVFATLYWASAEQRFANAFTQVDGYLQDWLRQRDGGYASAQLARPVDLRPGLSAADYWSTRREHDRRSLGIPPVQGRADSQARLALARGYLVAATAFSDPSYQAAADALLQQPPQAPDAACTSEPLRLGLQLKRLQQRVEPVTDAAVQVQDLLTDVRELLAGRLARDHCKPAGDWYPASRAALAVTLQQLALMSGELGLNDAPAVLLQQALAAVQGAGLEQQLPVLVAARALQAGPVVFLLEGAANDPRAQFLRSLASVVWEPRQVTLRRAGTDAQPAVLRICNPRVCALPIAAAAEPAPAAHTVRAALDQLATVEPIAISAQVPALLGLPEVHGLLSTSPSGATP